MTEKWQDVIKKLLAKAEDPACTQEEKMVILEKVTYLMTKYGIEEAMLRSTEKKEQVTNVIVNISNPYASKKATLLHNIAINLGCNTVRIGKGTRTRSHLFGFDSDVQRVYMLYLSLVVQMDNGLSQAMSNKPDYIHGKAYGSSWLDGFITTVISRIEKAYAKAQQDIKQAEGSGMELVLAKRDDMIMHAMNAEYGKLVSVTSHTRASSISGWDSGSAAGNRADIGQSRMGGGRKEIGS